MTKEEFEKKWYKNEYYFGQACSLYPDKRDELAEDYKKTQKELKQRYLKGQNME